MSRVQVKWIVPDGTDPDRRIDAIGGDGYCHRIDEAITNIRSNIHQYWVSVNGMSVNVVVAVRNRRTYLKTETDYYEPNNLLSLPHRRWAA